MQKGAVIMESEAVRPTTEELKRLSGVDIRTVDKKALVDIKDIHVRMDLPKEERMDDYIQQIKKDSCISTTCRVQH